MIVSDSYRISARPVPNTCSSATDQPLIGSDPVCLPTGAMLRNQFRVAVTFVAVPTESETVLAPICGDEMEMGGS